MARGILITGASSGLGRALALAYAEPGVHLFLTGRDPGRLLAVADEVRRRGAEATQREVEVTDREGMAAWIGQADALTPLRLVIANAGISAGTGGRGLESDEETRRILAVNIDGVVNTVLPAIDCLRRRGGGRIVLMSSLAGFRGMPTASAYCASKAAVRVWGEGLRGALAGDGIGVTVICPGFVETPLTAVNRFPMPFLMSADRAAALMRRAIDSNRARFSCPWPMAAMAWLLAALPPGLTDYLVTRLPAKG
ncbi:MAG: SDR family NAD(P)-dependent oxidoreductase [Telmatospirillum sp.]|nr:SDR family NAD(P)-dependent oxidoreductase [Telmatospirillum sp.]